MTAFRRYSVEDRKIDTLNVYYEAITFYSVAEVNSPYAASGYAPALKDVINLDMALDTKRQFS